MYGARLAYEVEAADTQSDRTEYRLIRTTKGRNAELYPALDELVETITERQARELRDSLDEVLDGDRDE